MKNLLLLALLSCNALVPGQEFWMQPEKFMVNVGDPVNIRFFTGDNYEGVNWSGNRSNIQSLQLYYANVTDELEEQFSGDSHGDSLQLSFYEEGTMMLAFIGNNDSTNAKTLVQVGNNRTNTYKMQTSLHIDIIPNENPYSIIDGKKLKVKLSFKKKPLANTTVRLWHRNNDETVKTALKTDSKGEVEFPVFTNGSWMISTVKANYSGSLTWGYPQ